MCQGGIFHDTKDEFREAPQDGSHRRRSLLDAFNALICLFSLVLAIQAERLITFLFYFNFNQQSA